MAIEVERLRGLDRPTLRRVLRAAARQVGVRLNFRDTARLLEVVSAPASRGSAKLNLSGGLVAERTPREVRLARGRSEPSV